MFCESVATPCCVLFLFLSSVFCKPNASFLLLATLAVIRLAIAAPMLETVALTRLLSSYCISWSLASFLLAML
jgi:hypothetical protein